MSTIYLVFGETGEHSDRDAWIVGWSASKDVAEALCHQASLETQAIKRRMDDPSYRSWEKHVIPSDPYFHMDYTGTRYYVSECEEIKAVKR